MTDEKMLIFKKFFATVIDRGGYYACKVAGNKKEWMYSVKLITTLSPDKLEKLLITQTKPC